MINQKNIKIAIIIVLVLFFMAELIYFVNKDQDREQQLARDQKAFEAACVNGGFNKINSTEEGKVYVNLEGNEECLSCLYNGYLFCDSVKSGSLDNNLEKIIKNENGFPTNDSIVSLFDRGKILNKIFKINDCSNSEIPSLVSEFAQSVGDLHKEERDNVTKLDSEEVCNLLMSDQINSDSIDEICSVPNCSAFLAKDTEKCDLIEDESEKQSCLDMTFYIKALVDNNKDYCMEINQNFDQVACQSYFIKNHPNMCDGIANTINEACDQ